MPQRDRCFALDALPRCEECGQPYTPFPIPESRLCAPCVYRVLARGGDGEARRRLLDTSLAAMTGRGAVEANELLAALAALPAVAHCALWERAGARLACAEGTTPGLPPPPPMAVAALGDPTFVDDLEGSRPALARRLRGWSWVAPLAPGGALAGALALVERVEPRLRRPGDLPLLATVAAAALVVVERRRRRREARVMAGAVRRARALTAAAAGEIRNALLVAHAALESGDPVRLREVGLVHLTRALGLCDALGTALSADALLGPEGRARRRSSD